MVLERSLMARADIWHRVRIIRGAYYDKETVLKAILKAVEPADLIPVNYHVSGEDTFFIARNCGPALEKLCATSLIIKNVGGDALILMLFLGYASICDLKINIQPLLLTALTKRYNPNEKILNLENFHTDPDVAKTVYCPLSQLRTSNHVLKLAKTAIATFEYLNLQHNEMHSIAAIENSNLTAVKYLDLRHNNLLNMCMLAPLKNLTIIKLWLDGNPLCENYSTVKQYVDSAKKYCPHLQELDGVCIGSKLPFIYKDYFVDNTRQLARKFTEHFFNLYDQPDRSVLRGLYHKYAVYSMSFTVPNIIAAKTNLQQYTAQSRNILRRIPKKVTTFYRGQEEILAGHAKLPKTYHDRSSFKYDVMYDNEKCLVLCISGLFKKQSLGVNVLSFNRTFILSADVDNEYHILNDQYHIDAAPENITPDKITTKVSYDENLAPICFSPSEKSVMMTRIAQVTTLNKEWCEIYLLGAKWDMRQALTSFMKDYKSRSIPEHAFYK